MTQYQERQPTPEEVSATAQRPPLFVAQLPTSNNGRKIQRVLIANRGEIACRVISTCRKLDLTSVAIYAEEDSSSRHVTEADEAVNLGSINQPGGNPFLNIPLLVEVAKSRNIDAIHPGYGYLSENEKFADAVREAGMIFVGPSSQAMSTLGDKRNSKEFLRKHAPNVPLIPGFAGSTQEATALEVAAEQIGFPVMIKASAGGGGRGMRIVRERSQLAAELATAQSEAKRSFGSSDCILEKYIEAAKHVEVQIMGDSHGKVVSLWERECSLQRRHQKVIEETPSPFLNPEQRRRMCATAVEIGERINYEGAGTVEFVVDARDGSYYFLEVNTRLQVEHPITEEVTGLDVVSLQLFVAAGGSLASLPNLRQIPQQGHAIECRLCAEDPASDFMPSNGTIRLWREAEGYTNSRDVRFESAVQTGSKVSIYFDSMIAKIVVWAPTREAAISKMVKVMANTVCAGVKTNQLFLQSCLLSDAFRNPAYTTSLIPQNLQSLLKNPHAGDAAQSMMSMLSVIPGLVQRDTKPNNGVPKPFKHIRQGFRNQYFDPVNRDTGIVDSPDLARPMLSVWNASAVENGHSKYQVSLVPVPEPENGDEVAKGNSAAIELSRQYQNISHILRAPALPSNASEYTVQLSKWQPLPAPGDNWITAAIAITINDSTIRALIATPPYTNASIGASRAFICHIPALGTWTSYTSYNLLTFMESLRPSIMSATGQSSGASSRAVKAPMPCKVLNVLKKDGDSVKAGEVVMVIESMKMETNISVSATGVFRTSVKVGDAVDDGKILCSVE